MTLRACCIVLFIAVIAVSTGVNADENRYKSILCDEENYVLALVRYIHLNPIRAGIVTTLEELDRYAWSGHRVLIGRSKLPWMDTDVVLSRFSSTAKKARVEYRL